MLPPFQKSLVWFPPSRRVPQKFAIEGHGPIWPHTPNKPPNNGIYYYLFMHCMSATPHQQLGLWGAVAPLVHATTPDSSPLPCPSWWGTCQAFAKWHTLGWPTTCWPLLLHQRQMPNSPIAWLFSLPSRSKRSKLVFP